MAAKTTVKVATLTGAAKDDDFGVLRSGLTEDSLVSKLAVLENDPGAARLYSLDQHPGSLASTFPILLTATSAKGATITINGDGTVGYDASGLSLQYLGATDTFTDTFFYTVRMANGALSTAMATVGIAGQNDAPTLDAVAVVQVLDTENDDTPGAVAGALVGADVDNGAHLTYSLAGGVAVEGTDTVVSTNEYGSLSLNTVTGETSFTADADMIDALHAGQTGQAIFTVQVTDEHVVSSDSVTVQFDLVGANDTASIDGAAQGDVAEDGTSSTDGALSVSDRDAHQSVFATVLAADLAGTYGDFSFDEATGAWSYALRNGDANVQALTGTALVHDALTVSSLDGTDSETITVNISRSLKKAFIPSGFIDDQSKFFTHGPA